MIKRNKIPTIIGIMILLVGTFVGVYFLRTTQIFKIGASATAIPKDVRVSNLSDTSATLSWITEAQTSDFISFGETEKTGTVVNESEDGSKYFTHTITVTGLKPSTTYYYKIDSEGTNFDNNGVAWQFATGPEISGNQKNIPVSGSVITASGQPSKRAIVYITVNGYLLSTVTSDAGSFVLQLGQVRSSDLSSFAQINIAQTLLEVSVEAEGAEISTAKIYPQSANPIPTLVLGQDKDYRDLQPNNEGQNPNADLSLPAGATDSSKFNITGTIATPSSSTVILESLNPGEIITSTQPQFFGKGPKGEPITITVHSQQAITGNVVVPSTGSWSWSPSTALAEGAHTITITWIDATGITRSLTRDFVVQAGEVPAFVASPSGSSPTPSATPISTPIPTSTPIVTLVATPIPTSTPTVIPTPVSTASAEPIPVTGDLTPTLMLLMIGIAIIAFSVFTWKFSER